jgi:hypothetical protein
MSHLLLRALQTIRYRMNTLLDLSRWRAAAADVVRFLEHAEPVLAADPPAEDVLREAESLVAKLRWLEPEQWQTVAAGLGAWEEAVRHLVEGAGERRSARRPGGRRGRRSP